MNRAATTANRPTVLGAANDIPPAVVAAEPGTLVVVPEVPPVDELEAGTRVLAPAASFLYSTRERLELAAVLFFWLAACDPYPSRSAAEGKLTSR
jgi:hypothetical protein